MASIKKRNDSFQITVSHGYDENGRQIRHTTTYRPPVGISESKAEKLAYSYACEFENKCKGISSINENMKFSELVSVYENFYMRDELKPVTAYNYKLQIDKRLIPYFGGMRLKAVNPIVISCFLEKYRDSPVTAKKIYYILQSIFSYAVSMNFIKETPCTKGVSVPKQPYNAHEQKPYLSYSQAKELMRMLKSDGYSQFSVIIRTLLYTGMRCGECIGLQWEDLDFENGMIHIRHTLTDVAGKHWLDVPKTKNSIRSIGMNDDLKNILVEHKKNQNIQNGDCNKNKRENLVFTSSRGGYVDRNKLNSKFKKYIENTDFAGITLHKLRHANATLLINSGVDLKLVSQHLGHSNISTTANIYADVFENTKKKIADIVRLNLE